MSKKLPKEYWVWIGMVKRCHMETVKNYKNYGGRGIKVCDAWLYDFNAFISDMGDRPTDKHSIERVNNDKGYSPENCIWATAKVQSRNRRSTVSIKANGKEQCLEDWANETGLSASTIRRRLNRMSPSDAVNKPYAGRRTKYIEFNGEKLTLNGWAKLLEVSRSTIEKRLKLYPIEIALTARSRGDLPKADCKPVLQYKGEDMIGEFFSVSQAGRETGVKFRLISATLRGKQRTAGGYVWKYK